MARLTSLRRTTPFASPHNVQKQSMTQIIAVHEVDGLSTFRLAFARRERPLRNRFVGRSLDSVQSADTPEGAPRLRPDYTADYFAAYVIDPDGYDIEAYRRSRG
jgi:hypothetical protein